MRKGIVRLMAVLSLAGLSLGGLAACADIRPSPSPPQAATVPAAPGSPLPPGGTAAPGGQLAAADGAAVPAGFRAVPWAGGLRQPGGLAVGDQGEVYVVEEGRRLLRLDADGGRDLLATAGQGERFGGIAASQGQVFVASRLGDGRGRVMQLAPEGGAGILLDGLPVGAAPPAALAVGPDGLLYVGLPALSDAGVVDGNELPPGARRAGYHDIPCEQVTLNGRNFHQDGTVTGAFLPLGTASRPGQTVAGHLPCTSAILSLRRSGGLAQMVAWGLRDPRALAFTPDGRLYVADGGFRGNGIRTVGHGGDLLFAVVPGVWYGWPDRTVSASAATATATVPPAPPLLAAAPNPPPRPLAEFAPWLRAVGLDIARAPLFGGVGEAYLALAQSPRQGGGLVETRVVRLDLANGSVSDFAWLPGGAPTGLGFSPKGDSLYVAEESGVLWRIERDIPVS